MEKDNHSLSVLEYDYIDKGIYIGNNQCCKLHFDEILKKEGVEIDLSLEEERIDAPFGVEMYFWIPTKDHGIPTMDQLIFGVKFLSEIVEAGKKVYVHCKNGHGRAPMFVIAYFIQSGMSLEDAIDFVKKRRPSVHLEKIQLEFLKKFSISVKK